jgi:hypothetical protein
MTGGSGFGDYRWVGMIPCYCLCFFLMTSFSFRVLAFICGGFCFLYFGS